MRALVVSIFLLASCRFDVSGTSSGADDDDDQGTVDASTTAPPDAPIQPAPADASPGNPTVQCGDQICGGTTICCSDWDGDSCTEPDACNGATVTCDGPSDCPGQDCCSYVGLWTGCADSCTGGDLVCDAPSACPGDQECCGSGGGPSTCQSFCF
jgi:hypothetical protein